MGQAIYSEEYKAIIEKLINSRLESGLTQLEVSGFLGISQSSISKIESSQMKLDVLVLKKLASLYGKEINYFLSNDS